MPQLYHHSYTHITLIMSDQKLKPEARNIVRKYKQLSRASKKERLPPNVFVFEKTRVLMMLHDWCASFFFFFERCRSSVPSMKSLRVSGIFFFFFACVIWWSLSKTRTKDFSLDCVILYPPSAISPKYVQFRKKNLFMNGKVHGGLKYVSAANRVASPA